MTRTFNMRTRRECGRCLLRCSIAFTRYVRNSWSLLPLYLVSFDTDFAAIADQTHALVFKVMVTMLSKDGGIYEHVCVCVCVCIHRDDQTVPLGGI